MVVTVEHGEVEVVVEMMVVLEEAAHMVEMEGVTVPKLQRMVLILLE